MYADADSASYRTQQNRSRKDQEFLAKLRTADEPLLRQILRDHRSGPKWKQVAIVRALNRLGRTATCASSSPEGSGE